MNTLKQNFPIKTALALGSNAPGSGAVFAMAAELLEQQGFCVERIANIIITEPVDCPPGTPAFFNSALIGIFNGTAEELLDITQGIEQKLGRPADHGFHLPRPLDIDIIIFGSKVMNTPRLILPHPRAQERMFVIEPLNEIAPDWVFPDSSLSVAEVYLALKNSGYSASQLPEGR